MISWVFRQLNCQKIVKKCWPNPKKVNYIGAFYDIHIQCEHLFIFTLSFVHLFQNYSNGSIDSFNSWQHFTIDWWFLRIFMSFIFFSVLSVENLVKPLHSVSFSACKTFLFWQSLPPKKKKTFFVKKGSPQPKSMKDSCLQPPDFAK